MRSFFNYFRIIEDAVTNDEEYSDICKAAIQRLKGYVEGGAYAPGPNSAWVCKRWRLSCKELSEEWKREVGLDKSEATFRCQIHTLSKTLFSLFPEEDFGALLSGENDNITRTLDALAFDNKPFCTIYPEAVCKYTGVVEQDYAMADLESEIRVLKAINTVKNRYKELDPDKLSFIRNVVDAKVVDCPQKPQMLRALGLC